MFVQSVKEGNFIHLLCSLMSGDVFFFSDQSSVAFMVLFC